jgi:DNA-binding transcriptional MerR regulator
MRVAELAQVAGVSADMVRYYERVRFIQGGQRLGLRLRDIGELLAVRDTGVCPCEPAEELLKRRLGELDTELARLTALRTEMVRMIDALPAQGCPPPVPGTWCPPDADDRAGGDRR